MESASAETALELSGEFMVMEEEEDSEVETLSDRSPAALHQQEQQGPRRLDQLRLQSPRRVRTRGNRGRRTRRESVAALMSRRGSDDSREDTRSGCITGASERRSHLLGPPPPEEDESGEDMLDGSSRRRRLGGSRGRGRGGQEEEHLHVREQEEELGHNHDHDHDHDGAMVGDGTVPHGMCSEVDGELPASVVEPLWTMCREEDLPPLDAELPAFPCFVDCGTPEGVPVDIDSSIVQITEQAVLNTLSMGMPGFLDPVEGCVVEPSVVRLLRHLRQFCPSMAAELQVSCDSFLETLEQERSTWKDRVRRGLVAPPPAQQGPVDIDHAPLALFVHEVLRPVRLEHLRRNRSSRPVQLADCLKFLPLGMAVHLEWSNVVQLVSLALSHPPVRDTRDFVAAALFLLQVDFLATEHSPVLNVLVSACNVVERQREGEPMEFMQCPDTPVLTPQLALVLYFRTAHQFRTARQPRSALWYMRKAQEYASEAFVQGHWIHCCMAYHVRFLADMAHVNNRAESLRALKDLVRVTTACTEPHERAAMRNLFEVDMGQALVLLVEECHPLLQRLRDQEAEVSAGRLQQVDMALRRRAHDARQRVIGLLYSRCAEVKVQCRYHLRECLAQWYARDESISLDIVVYHVLQLILKDGGQWKAYRPHSSSSSSSSSSHGEGEETQGERELELELELELEGEEEEQIWTGERQVEIICKELLPADLLQWLESREVPVTEWPQLVRMKVTSLRALRNLRIRRLSRAAEMPTVIEGLRAELKRPGDVTCCVCLDALPNMMFRKCRHVCMCSVCFSLSGQKPECPLCRTASSAMEVLFS